MQYSRRQFMKVCAGAAVASGAFPKLSFAATPGGENKVLMINLNGGMDGLAMLQPNSGALYSTLAAMRPTIALNPASLLAGDSQFSFHPLLTIFKSAFDEARLNAVLNVGYKNMSRSHLDSEITFARGVNDRFATTATGLMDRIGAAYGWDSLRAISVTGNDPFFAGGNYRAVQASSLDDLYFRSGTGDYHDLPFLVDSTYGFTQHSNNDSNKPKQEDYQKNLDTVINTTDSVRAAIQALPLTGQYPTTQFGRALRSAEIALRASQIDSQIAYMRCGGFDTHSNQTTVLNKLLTEFNAALTVFVNNAKATGLWNRLIIMVFSEFGRTNKENGSTGTDHGGANPVFFLGGKVNGGGFHGTMATTALTNYGWLPAQYNVAEVYRLLLAKLNLDPDRIVSASDGPSLSGLFL